MSTEPVQATAVRAAVYSRREMQPYGGYYANHIAAHDPALTETGPKADG